MLTEIQTRLSRHRTLRQRLMLLSVAVLSAIPAGALLAQAAPGAGNAAPFTVVETGKGYDRLQDAINSLGEGDGTIRIAPGTWHDCGVQPHGNVTYVAAVPGQAIFDGKVCEDDAKVSKVDNNAGETDARVRGADAEVASVKAQRPLTHCNACSTNKHAQRRQAGRCSRWTSPAWHFGAEEATRKSAARWQKGKVRFC